MSEAIAKRTLLSGKLVSNFGQSTIDCVVRSLSEAGACVQVQSTHGVPDQFELVIQGRERKPCRVSWKSEDRIGVNFVGAAGTEAQPETGHDLVRGQMLALRAALDEIEIGVVLLDGDMRSQFINKAFRRMWKLPDAKADAKIPFVGLMYHGRDTGAYEVPSDDLDTYVTARVERVKAGDIAPLDLRLKDGSVLRFQCAVLPNGGRLLTYTAVTDIVRHSDELETLRSALDNVEDGVMLFDSAMQLDFINRKARAFWSIPPDIAAPGTSLISVMQHTQLMFDSPAEQFDAFVATRLAKIRAGDPAPQDIRTIDGKIMRAHCTKLAGGGRMLTYCDVTDLVRNAERLETLAAIDGLTGITNRRQFLSLAEAEWSRFQRYHRPLTMVMLDIDHFKSINDRYGHATGDEVIRSIARSCSDGKRASDVTGRIGGEEFAILLPETDLAQAHLVAERLRETIAARLYSYEKINYRITVSIGIAAASLSMSGVSALLRDADLALYQAKALGRNRVALYQPQAPAELRRAAE